MWHSSSSLVIHVQTIHGFNGHTAYIFTTVSESRVMTKTFGSKRNEVTGNWKKLLKEELRDLQSTPTITGVLKENEMNGACST